MAKFSSEITGTVDRRAGENEQLASVELNKNRCNAAEGMENMLTVLNTKISNAQIAVCQCKGKTSEKVALRL